jgi:D-3-phosphoglycerate dehydrogenase
MMKVLIADKLSDTTVSALEALGAEVTTDAKLTAEDLPAAIGDAEVLVVRSTKVTSATIDAAPALSLIVRAGAGVNTIDLAAASSRGIHVANCPGKNTDAVAELAIGLLIAADRRIVGATNDLRAGRWRKKEYGKAHGLKGRTLGIVGLGAIGKAVACRARGLEMNVVAWSRSLTEEKAEALGVGYCQSPLALADQADAVAVHLASKPETKHLIGTEFLSHMKDGAILINASRGEVVDTAALIEAVKAKNLRVGLDVYENEPSAGAPDFDQTELAELVSCTPHIGASTDQASEATAEEVVRVIKTYKDTGKPVNTVNIRATSSAVTNLVIRHYNHVGVLAGVLDELRNEDVNIEEMENTIFDGGQTASCTLRIDSEPSPKTIEKISGEKYIIQVMLK